MDNKKVPHQGEILMLLVKRSGMDGKDVAKAMEINQSYLSKMFNFPALTDRVKRAAVKALGVDGSVFDQGIGYVLPDAVSTVGESRTPYNADAGSISPAQVALMIEEHRKERARLLAIIEKLVEK